MQMIVLEDGEEAVLKMDIMEAAITNKIGALGDQLSELITNTAEKQVKEMKEEMAQLKEELRVVRRELKRVTKISRLNNIKKNEEGEGKDCEYRELSPEWQFVQTDPSDQPFEPEEVNKDSLEKMPVVSDQILEQDEKPLQQNALKRKSEFDEKEQVKTAVENSGESGKKSPEEEGVKELSSSPLPPLPPPPSPISESLPQLSTSLSENLDKEHPQSDKLLLTSVALSGDVDQVRKLLKNGAKIRMRDPSDFNALHLAALCGFVDVAKALLEVNKNMVATRVSSKDFATSLHLAAEKGHKKVAEVLIEFGADVSAKNSKGFSPLHTAAMNGHAALVNLLLEKGAHVMCVDKCGQTPLHLGAKGGHIDVVNALLDYKADVRRVNSSQQTALHLACSEGHLSVVKVLFYRGSEIDKIDIQKFSPLHYASANGRIEIVKFLLGKSVNTMLLSTQSETALCCAAKNGHHEVVKALIVNGVQLTTSDQNALTALDIAAGNKHSWVVCTLFEAVPDITGPVGDMAVLATVEHNLVHALKALILEGANPNAKAANLRPAVEIAAEKNHGNCIKILEDAGAAVPMKGFSFTTATTSTTNSVFGNSTGLFGTPDPTSHSFGFGQPRSTPFGSGYNKRVF